MKLVNFGKQIYLMNSSTNVAKFLQTVAKLEEEAFYVLDIGTIIRKHQEWLRKLPRVTPYYAVNCNDNIVVLETLATLGVGFSSASKGELDKVLNLGVGANRIIFANPTKPASYIRHAASLGIKLMTFDNRTELYKVKELHPKAKLAVHIRCDTENVIHPLGVKFGCHPQSEAPLLLKLARSLGLEVVGVTFQVGSDCEEPLVFRKAITLAKGVFALGSELGFDMHLLDLGGGFPSNYDTSIDNLSDDINLALNEYFPPETNTQIIAEPGGFYVASAFKLALNIHSKRDVFSDTKELLHTMFYVNGGVYSSFVDCVIFDGDAPKASPLAESKSDEIYSCSLWGPTCDSTDCIIESTLLPKMDLGDWIVFPDVGAYSLAKTSLFNGFPLPKVYAVIDEKTWDQIETGHGLLVRNGFKTGLDHSLVLNIQLIPLPTNRKQEFRKKSLLKDKSPFIDDRSRAHRPGTHILKHDASSYSDSDQFEISHSYSMKCLSLNCLSVVFSAIEYFYVFCVNCTCRMFTSESEGDRKFEFLIANLQSAIKKCRFVKK